MADYLGGLPAFSCSMEFRIAFKGAGTEANNATTMSARLQRPNRFALVTEEGNGITLISDGKQLVQYVPMLKRYTVSAAPASLDELDESNEAAGLSMIGSLPVPTSGDAFYKSLMDGVTKSEYLGTEKVGETECHHCRFQGENMDWEIWIATGKEPLVHKVVPDLSKRFAGAGGKFADVKMSYVVTFADWKTDPKFTDADFSFTPPADAEEVDSLFGGEFDEGPHPLLGQPAPPFETVDLDEQPFDLKKYLGKNVIILDFWATWCGPCVEALPQIDAVAKKYADKGVIFRAVNAGEDAATIKEFLESSQLGPPVAMDIENQIAPLYKVEGIPQTVLIGKDGKVQVVHVGFSESIGEHLSKQIEDLLAGRDLAGPELKKAEDARKKKADRAAAAKSQSGANEDAMPSAK
jgi:peroxiredoxin